MEEGADARAGGKGSEACRGQGVGGAGGKGSEDFSSFRITEDN